MVRRWSSINNFNLFFKLSKIKFFKKIIKKRIFKLTVSTRRFYKKYSKFRRKAFNRLRHKNNWTVYTNVFKFWSHDYLKAKTFYKKYWLMGFHKINILSFNWNSLKNTNVDLFFNTTYSLLSLNSFFNFRQNNYINSILIDFNKKNANLSIAYVESLENFYSTTEDRSDVILYSDLQFYENYAIENFTTISDYYTLLNNLKFYQVYLFYVIFINTTFFYK